MKPACLGRQVSAVLVAISGIGGSVWLKVSGVIGELSLIVLLAASVLVGLFIAYVDRVHSIKISEMELTLKEAKEVEASVKKLATAVLNVFEAESHGMMLESYDAKKAQEAVAELKALIA